MQYGNPIDLLIIIMRPGVESIVLADVIILVPMTHRHPSWVAQLPLLE